MKKESVELLEKLSLLDGVSGFEGDVRDFMRGQLEGYATFETDNLGSLVCKKVGLESGPRIIFPAHMDECGFMVKDVTDDGYVRLANLAGLPDQVMLAHNVTIKTRKGDLKGVIASTPPHIMTPEDRAKVTKREQMFVDIGARDKKHATGPLGVRIGDPIVPEQPFRPIGDGKHLLGKAWDDRAGCALVIDLIKALANVEHPNVVYGVGTVQEEVGIRGAQTSADVVNPDFCVTLDVGIATDMPGGEKETKVKLGAGPVLYLRDAGTIAHHKFHSFVVDIADKKKIPYQLSVMESGSTDARAIHLHRRGVPSVWVSVPARYIHSHAGIIHTDDYDASLKLLVEIVKALSSAQAKKLGIT